ncbi:hypothetical protein V3C99_018191 [Haemonchus contortus]|uniref:Zinc finger domain containing protein n=1 Tax=Haemonchus contortus TaxID=6289 RepID=A0A7I4Z5L4_HAECO
MATHRGQIDVKEVMTLIKRDVQRLGTTIKEITEYMATAEKEVKSNRREMEAAELLKKSVQAMQDQLQVLKKWPSKSEATRLDKLQPPQETDDQHFDCLLRESSGDQKEERSEEPTRRRVLPESEPFAEKPCSSKTSAKKAKSSTDQRAAEELEAIRGEIRAMESMLDRYPHRLIVEYSKGIDPRIDCSFCGVVGAHFSDSCPHVVKGNQRLQVAISCGRCYKCMKFCNGTCPNKEKEKGCFYCEPLRGTLFEVMTPPYAYPGA